MSFNKNEYILCNEEEHVFALGEYLKLIEKINKSESEEHSFPESKMWYRGQSNYNWHLIPKIQRIKKKNGDKITEKELREYERGFSTRFQIKASQMLREHPDFDNYPAWLTLMRHHEVPTRLLDWSLSPLVALYFAIEEHKMQNDACVWVLNPRALNECEHVNKGDRNPYVYTMAHRTVHKLISSAFKKEDNEKDKICACYPIEHYGRVYNQQSAFTVHNTLRVLDTLDNIYEKNILYKVIIPRECIPKLKEQLKMCNFTQSYMYPDLDHLSNEVCEKYNNITF